MTYLVDVHMVVRFLSIVNPFDLMPEAKLHEIIVRLDDLLMDIGLQYVRFEETVDTFKLFIGLEYFFDTQGDRRKI